jgi:hypothetical protein
VQSSGSFLPSIVARAAAEPRLQLADVLEIGELRQFLPALALAASSESSRVIADVRPASVRRFRGVPCKRGAFGRRQLDGQRLGHARGAQPPSATAAAAEHQQAPPRRLTNSRIMSCWAGVIEAASKLPISAS